MKKILAILLAISCLAAILAGCGQIGQTGGTTAAATAAVTKAATTGPETTSSATAPEFPVTVQDASGKDVVIASVPQSIIITNIWAAEMVLEMVDASRIKGLSAWGDDPVLSATAELAGAVAERVSTQEPEKIVSLEPDLVVIDTFSDPDGSLSKTLTEAGATVLQMNSPTNFTEIKAAIATLAAAVGEFDAGQELIAAIDAKLQLVAIKVSGLADAERLKVMYYEDYYDPSGSSAGMLAAYGAGSPFAAIAEAAGLINVCNAPNYSAVSKEKVIGEWQPDLLVVPAITYGSDFTVIDDQGKTIIQAIKADELMTTLPAVQNGRVIALTEKYRGSTSQYMADAVVELAAAAYPDLFK